jgi:hypothetical protein
MGTYGNAFFTGHGYVNEYGDYIAAYVEIRDLADGSLITTESMDQGITFDSLGMCANQLVTLGNICTNGRPSDCKEYLIWSTWTI